MATNLEYLKAVSAYPIPTLTVMEIAQRRGVNLDAEATESTLNGAPYNLAKADIYMWLGTDAPDVSQGGQSYSFTDKQRERFINIASKLFSVFEDNENSINKTVYGYKGSRL